MSNEEEIWKTYPDYDFIEVSNLGRVRTKDRYVPGMNESKRLIKGRVLKQHFQKNGYMYVGFRVNCKYVNLRVHRMVAVCFVPNPDNLPEINHIDNDPTNNRWDNLEWCNHQENIAYREKYGVSARKATEVLRKHVIAVDLSNLNVFWFETRSEAEHRLGILNQSISKVIKGRLNRTHDYWFCNADENAVEKARAKFGDEVAEKVEKLINENYN